MRETVSVIIILIVFSQFLNDQSITQSPETDARPEPMQEVFDLHFPDHHVKKIHGRPYLNPYPRITEHQFFKTSTPGDGIIFTLSDTIHCAYILYDIFRDKIIVFEPAVRAFIELEDEFILHFRLFEGDGDHAYEFIIPEVENDTMGIRWTGFHQVLYKGEMMDLYKKHLKTYTATIEDTYSVVRFINKERLVLRKDDEYFWIKRNRDLLKIYPELKADIRRFLRSSGIYIQHASDDQIQITGQFVDQLGLQSEIQEPGK